MSGLALAHASRASGGGEPLLALRELRRARKANRLQGLPWGETLYRVYLIVIGVGGIVWWIAAVLGERQVSASSVADVRRLGPSVVGCLLAVLAGNSLRSGARGAALTIEPADVAHVLQSPLPRLRVLRRPAVHTLRRGLSSAFVVGAATGPLTAPFLPGGPGRWTVFSGAIAAVFGLGLSSLALVVSGRRFHPRVALLLSVTLLGWSVADVARASVTSPFSFAGTAFLRPMPDAPRFADSSALGICMVTIALLALAFTGLGGVGIEAAERRARLISQLRFAVSTQDLRGVVLLRRQLASERARRRPWFRVRGQAGPERAIVVRSLRSLARWPVARVVRVLVLAIVAGVLLRLAYEGAFPLVVLSALCFFVMGLDLVEPLAQDADRPDLLKSLPRHRGRMANRQLIVPTIAAALLGLLGGAAAIATGISTGSTVGPNTETALALLFTALCGAVLGSFGGAVNVAQGPPSLSTMLSTPEFAFLRTALPVILTVIGTAGPLFSCRIAATDAKSPSVYPGIVRGLLVVGLIGYGVVLWITDGGIREPK